MTGMGILRDGFIGVLMLCLPMAAQEAGRRHFAVLGPDQGLAPAAVTCLTQDNEGFIWMGTENGLIRYEGGMHRRWGTDDGLPASYITGLLPAPGGGLWVATPSGLVRFRNGQVERTRFGAEFPATRSCTMALDTKGRLWATTSEGLFVQQETPDLLQFDLLIAEPRLFQPVAGARGGGIFVPSSRGLRCYRPDGSVQSWGPADGLPEGGPQVVAEDGAGRIWAGSGRTLVMKEPAGARFKDQSPRLGASLTPNSAAFGDPDGSVWLATQNGALHLTGDQTQHLDAMGGLPFRWVRTLFRDREGTLWLVGPGVARLQGGGRVWNYTLTRDVSGEVVWAITRDRDGTLMVGTDDGAARMEPAGLQRIPGTAGHRIKALARGPDGTLWLVNSMGPALWLRPGQSVASLAPLGPLGVGVNHVMVDTQKRVWLSHTLQGILRWDPERRQLVREVGPDFARAPTLGVYRTVEDATGRLWAATTQGLLLRERDGHWQLFTDKDGLRPNALHGLAFLPDGSAWIYHQEPYGLTRVRVEGGRLAVLERRTQQDGLCSDLIFGVQVDGQGQTWVSTDQGLNRLAPLLHVGRRDGMPSEDCSINSLLVEAGHVWVGTAGGLVRFDTGGAPASSEAPVAHILQMTTGGRRLEPPFGAIGPVPFRDATVVFRIAAPLYNNEGALRFQVRLQGLDETWRDPLSKLVRYPSLPGGQYRFEVRAADGLGAFGPVASLAFTVRPPWYKTRWAYLLLAMGGGGALFGLVRLRLGTLARSQAALEALVTLRTLELRKRNEELSQAMSKVKQLSGLVPICANCKKIRDDSGYWNQLESYLTQHSGVDFSHGICPECVELMYPELAPKVLGKKGANPPSPHSHECPNNGTSPK